MTTSKKAFFIKLIKDSISIFAGAFLSSLALNSFIIPNGFVGGGVGGIATIIEVAGILKSYWVILICNIPLLIASVIWLKKDFAIKTISVTFLTSFILAVMDKYNFFVFTEDRLLAAIYSGLMYGTATGLLFEAGGSTGGTEIIAKLVAIKRPATKLSAAIFIMDVVIILFGLTVFDIWSVAYAVICSFCYERALAFYLNKDLRKGVYFIITEQPKKVHDALFAVFNVNNTLQNDVIGGFTGNKKALLRVYLPTGNINKLKTIVNKTDPQAFSYSASATELSKGEK